MISVASSCRNATQDWLDEFSGTNCALQTELEEYKTDSVQWTSPITNELNIAQSQLVVIMKPYQNEISKLKEGITAAHTEYMKAYRKAEEEHSSKYGHVSTPSYENKISKLKEVKAEKTEALQGQIEVVTAKMEADTEYIALTGKIKSVTGQIIEIQASVFAKHKYRLDSLKEQVSFENSNYEGLRSELGAKEQESLDSKRDSILVHPCQ